jgi:hypothetical protein
MDRYHRVEKPRPEAAAISENEIRITTQGLIRNYVTYATSLVQVPSSSGSRCAVGTTCRPRPRFLLGLRASDQILLPRVEAAIIAERGPPAVLRSEGFGSERTDFRVGVVDYGVSYMVATSFWCGLSSVRRFAPPLCCIA